MDRILGAIIFLSLAVSFQSFEIASSTERPEPCFGCLLPAKLNEDKIHELLCNAQTTYNQLVDPQYAFKAIHPRNINITVQRSEGIKYTMSALLQETECKRRDKEYTCEEIQACPTRMPVFLSLMCDFSIWETPWRKDVKFVCHTLYTT